MSAITSIKPELLAFTWEHFLILLPYVFVFGAAALAMFFAFFRSPLIKWPVFLVTVVGALMGIASSWYLLEVPSTLLFNEMMVVDSYSSFFSVVFISFALLTVLLSFRYLDREELNYPEYYILVLFSCFGMMLMASALDLIVLFIALELMSLAIYVLVAFRRHDRMSNEAAVKYFVLGSVASAILLYGVALLYGATQTTNIKGILAFVQVNTGSVNLLFVLGAWLVTVGFLFKVACVPFHVWMPDVYEGAPTPITAFMTTGLKAAAFAAFIRVFVYLGYGKMVIASIESHIHGLLWFGSVATMIVGNVIALKQNNVKRMLAYSSIAHTGYILVGFLIGPGEGNYASIVTYLVIYAIMNMGAFAVLTVVASKGDGGLNMQDFAGLSKRSPWLAFALALFLFSMAGIPPTAGFIGKFYLFYSAVQANEILLVVIAVLCSAISIYYYLRVVVQMYMRTPDGQLAPISVPFLSVIVIGLTGISTVQLGILPSFLLNMAKKAVGGL